ncbi:phosphotriesterase [Vibrio mimicus]|uniref:phosphotriesterase family protein n=2 Tax=Vibrio mimicus TaxID=674 RepID=UPI002F935388
MQEASIMTFIRTLNGDISPEQLGVTYSHDHIFCVPPYWKDKGETDLLLDDFHASFQELLDFKAVGGQAIYDATAPDYGRHALIVAQMAKEVGIHVVGTAGFNKGFLWSSLKPHTNMSFETYIANNSVEQLAQDIIEEVTIGIENSPHKAGVVKCGTGYNQIHPLEQKTMQAVVKAALETGAPLHSHTELGTMALEQVEIFEKCGMDLGRVAFAHMDRNPDKWLLTKLAHTGSFICFDGVSRIKYYTEEVRSQALIYLCKSGFSHQILIGGDFARKSMSAHYGCGGLGMRFILNSWQPRFCEEANDAGLDGEALLHQFFIENPKRYLTFTK